MVQTPGGPSPARPTAGSLIPQATGQAMPGISRQARWCKSYLTQRFKTNCFSPWDTLG
ncbi:MAG TPA: hypothetical protein VGX70_11395 [Gemmataceae bacterium]|nr:hypothetical protein [Gemmataceae bacterium]